MFEHQEHFAVVHHNNKTERYEISLYQPGQARQEQQFDTYEEASAALTEMGFINKGKIPYLDDPDELWRPASKENQRPSLPPIAEPGLN